MKIRKITLFAILATILFIQEQLLSFLPNIQCTVLLIILYTKVLGIIPTSIIVTIHVLLDSIFNASLTPLISIPMLLGWLLIPITLGTIFKNAKKPLILALFSVLYSVCYSVFFLITKWLFLDVNIIAYLISDIPFIILLAGSSFISVLWLFTPLYNLLSNLLNQIKD